MQFGGKTTRHHALPWSDNALPRHFIRNTFCKYQHGNETGDRSLSHVDNDCFKYERAGGNGRQLPAESVRASPPELWDYYINCYQADHELDAMASSAF